MGVTYLQIFGIGFSFGLIGPCVLTCTPVILTYIAGRRNTLPESAADIFIFLIGRLAAYIMLGALAGFSGKALNHFIGSNFVLFLRPLGGAVSILLGFALFMRRKENMEACARGPERGKTYSLFGLFVLGFVIGIKACAPLLVLLSEITLISKSALEGASYGFSFGLGTFISSYVVTGVMVGVIAWLPPRIFRSKRSGYIFRAACALLLVLFGLSLIMNRIN